MKTAKKTVIYMGGDNRSVNNYCQCTFNLGSPYTNKDKSQWGVKIKICLFFEFQNNKNRHKIKKNLQIT